MRRRKRVTVSDGAIKEMISKNTRASARLEGREVPDGHARSQDVQDYLDAFAFQKRSDASQGLSASDSEKSLPIVEANSIRVDEANSIRASLANWNYRVVQSADESEYFIAEVYYDGDKLGWVDKSRDCLRWGRYNDLRNTVHLIQDAFARPLLRVTEDDRLIEIAPT
ncbi:hypothetical protein AU184_25800 [Mycolicibacterium novocastrense]|uniref:hypothetical protein n=1 Tax=Mycolicibacterium novocastrense TaxID=59813 RepID=UPI0007465EA3|nr:hypothetical protein [Mycolicibacterium novocastrense]KUH67538.1 hypothetical protein AU072_01445 [Mycolicibacterium novocastrense]KUH71389.1 hypothetical protein AU183_06320 [Mycolicibacterium novocastrense]KUH73276.1 hypothetical protein AU184_25800 [Mycolicibacterium novocastrense]